MAPSTATTQAITAHASYNHPIQRISHRTKPLPLTIQPPDPSWPAQFQALRAALQAALPSATAVHHAGSTAVPNLPAKAVLDIDLVVPDPDDEASYVAALVGSGWDEASGSSSGVGQGGVPGLRFLFREPGWHGHRFMVREEDAERGVMAANVHVFGPGCPEVERHRIFREWLCEHPDDVEKYAAAKREAAQASREAGETMNQYSARKDVVIQEILDKAFRALGLLD